MNKIIVIGTIHYDPKGEKRLKRATNLFNFDVVFIEGVENWSKFKEGMKKIKKEMKKKASKLPEEDKKKIIDRLEGKERNALDKNKGYEYKIKKWVSCPILYLDDESYIDSELNRYRGFFLDLLEDYHSLEEDDSNKNIMNIFIRNYITLFLTKHPEIDYEIFSGGKVEIDLKKLVIKDLEELEFFNVKENKEKTAEKIISEMNIKENISYFYKNKSYERDKKWKRKLDEYTKSNPNSKILCIVGLGHIGDNPKSFYSLLSKDYDVKRYTLKEIENLNSLEINKKI